MSTTPPGRSSTTTVCTSSAPSVEVCGRLVSQYGTSLAGIPAYRVRNTQCLVLIVPACRTNPDRETVGEHLMDQHERGRRPGLRRLKQQTHAARAPQERVHPQ